MDLNEKKLIVEDLHGRFSKSKVVIVTDYKGLNVAAMNQLRRKLREAQIEYRVAKNSLLIRASEETDVAMIKSHFQGPCAIALSYDDPVAPAKILTAFAKENEMLEIKAGVMNGTVLDLAKIKALSNLPSREELLATMLSALNSVPTGFVRVLNAVPQNFMNVLQAIKEQKEAA
jgi:large subunit ribosomal protein L10